MLLAYDRVLNTVPSLISTTRMSDPSYVMDIAVKGGFNGIVFQKGVAEKY